MYKRLYFKEILEDEEEHHDLFTTMLKKCERRDPQGCVDMPAAGKNSSSGNLPNLQLDEWRLGRFVASYRLLLYQCLIAMSSI